MTNRPQYTTAEIAAKLDRDVRTIRMHATRYNLGTLITPRLRLFSDEDVAILEQIKERGPGEKRKEPQR